LFRNNLGLNAKYLLVHTNNETPEKLKLGLRGASISKTETHLDASSRAIFQGGKSRIIGGNEIKPHSEPWLALLCVNNQTEGCECAGSLISSKFVLTAAHCDSNGMTIKLRHRVPNLTYVLLGGHDKYNFTGTEKFVKIKKWITHPQARDFQNNKPYGKWDQDIVHYDFSLLLLSRNVKYTSNIQPIALPEKSDQNYKGKSLLTAGWGYTKVLREKTPWGNELIPDVSSNVPKKVIVMAIVHDANSCKNQGFFPGAQDMCKHCGLDVVLCTYGKKHFNRTIVEDACGGDSGGPLFLNDGNHKPTLIGVTSFGRACGQEKSPAIFAKVDHVLDWINRTMSKYD